jgi:hypothetical protein
MTVELDSTPPPPPLSSPSNLLVRGRYQTLSHALWARQQQQRAQIDEEITRVMRPPQSAAPSTSQTVQVAPPEPALHTLSPMSMNACTAAHDGAGGGGRVKVTVTVTRCKDSAAAAGAESAAQAP